MSDTWVWVVAVWCWACAAGCVWEVRRAQAYYRDADAARASARLAIAAFTWPSCARCGPVDVDGYPWDEPRGPGRAQEAPEDRGPGITPL